MNVEDLMSATVVTVRESERIEHARYQMETAELHHLPVVNECGRLVGILSDSDIFRSRGFVRNPSLVSEIMTRNVRTVTPKLPAYEAVRLMLDLKIGSLPVVMGAKLVGILTQTDFLSMAYRALQPAEKKVA